MRCPQCRVHLQIRREVQEAGGFHQGYDEIDGCPSCGWRPWEMPKEVVKRGKVSSSHHERRFSMGDSGRNHRFGPC